MIKENIDFKELQLRIKTFHSFEDFKKDGNWKLIQYNRDWNGWDGILLKRIKFGIIVLDFEICPYTKTTNFNFQNLRTITLEDIGYLLSVKKLKTDQKHIKAKEVIDYVIDHQKMRLLNNKKFNIQL